jgi:hypothetical protein
VSIPTGYVPKKFPAFRYHPTAGKRIVSSQAESDALGPEWFDTPAAFRESAAPVLPPSRAEAIAAPPSAEAQSVWNTGWKKVAAKVAEMTSLEKLAIVAKIERANPKVKGGRDHLLAAIDARVRELTAPTESFDADDEDDDL